jgi:hypothetical protein
VNNVHVRSAAALLCLHLTVALNAQQTELTASSLTVPRLVRFSGTFRPANSLPAAPVESVTVAVYRDQYDGAPLWQETQNVQIDANGQYALLMGTTRNDGIPAELFTSAEPRWLGVQFNRPGEVEQPRILMVSVPYALKALDAETLGGRPASAYLVAPSAVSDNSNRSVTRLISAARNADSSDILTAAADTFFGQSSFVVNDATGQFTGISVQNTSGGGSAYSGMLFFDHTGALGQFQGFNNSTKEYRINNLAAGGTINFLLGSTSRFRIANNGNVGIGSTSPGEQLTVASARPYLRFDRTGGGSAFVGMSDGSPGLDFLAGFPRTAGHPESNLHRLWITQLGSGGEHTGIVLNDETGVHVFGPGDGGWLFAVSDEDSLGPAVATLDTRFIVRNTGDVGIGTNTPSDKLHVTGELRVANCVKNASGTQIAGVCPSDARLKTNIEPFAPVLSRLAQMRPVHFDWRVEEHPEYHFGTSRSYGLIAQEIEQDFPELVSEDSRGFKAVDYSKLPLVLLQAVREQNTETNDIQEQLRLQQDQNQQQAERIHSLETRLAQMEALLAAKASTAAGQ